MTKNGYLQYISALGVVASIADWYSVKCLYLDSSGIQAVLNLRNRIADALPTSMPTLTRKDSRRIASKILSVCSGIENFKNIDLFISKAVLMIDDQMSVCSGKQKIVLKKLVECLLDVKNISMNERGGNLELKK